ncbi:MAG: hypothetical protein ACRCX2_35135 [Paraclostridium sp.]
MSLQIKGLQTLIDDFEKQTKVKVSKNALKKAGEYVLSVEKEVAGQEHDTWARPKGVNNLKKFPIRSYQGSAYIDIGLKGGKVDWSAVRGLYFNHYGFFHNKTGKYVAGSRWMDIAYDKSEEKAFKMLSEEMLKEIGIE